MPSPQHGPWSSADARQRWVSRILLPLVKRDDKMTFFVAIDLVFPEH